jgi:hypothetical protein
MAPGELVVWQGKQWLVTVFRTSTDHAGQGGSRGNLIGLLLDATIKNLPHGERVICGSHNSGGKDHEPYLQNRCRRAHPCGRLCRIGSCGAIRGWDGRFQARRLSNRYTTLASLAEQGNVDQSNVSVQFGLGIMSSRK